MPHPDDHREVSFTQIVDAVQRLPRDAVVEWTDDAYLFHPGAHGASFIDVYAPLVCDPTAMNWAWTIVPTTTEEDGPAWSPGSDVQSALIRLEPDAMLWSVQRPDFSLDQLNEAAAYSVLCLSGDEPTAEQLRHLHSVAARTGGDVIREQAWTFATLNTALCLWASHHAGRDDLSFAVDHELVTPMLARLEAIIEADKASEQPEGYEIAPGVRAGSHAFDQLLAMDQDDAARITAVFAKIAENTRTPDA